MAERLSEGGEGLKFDWVDWLAALLSLLSFNCRSLWAMSAATSSDEVEFALRVVLLRPSTLSFSRCSRCATITAISVACEGVVLPDLTTVGLLDLTLPGGGLRLPECIGVLDLFGLVERNTQEFSFIWYEFSLIPVIIGPFDRKESLL